MLTAWTTVDGRTRLASAGTDAKIRIWDPDTAEEIGAPLLGHTATVWKLATHRGMLVSAGEDGILFVWNLATRDRLSGPVEAHTGWVRAIALWDGPDETPRLASAGSDGTVRLWDPATGTSLGEPLLAGPDAPAALACWTGPSGNRLAVASDDGTIRFWDPDTRRTTGPAPLRHGGGPWALATWSTVDGARRLASAGMDGTIRVWDPEAGTPVGQPLRGHTGWIPTLATWTGPDGRTQLASASTDGSIRIWDTDTGTLAGPPITGHAGSLPTLTTWIAEGRRLLAFVGEGGLIQVFDVDSARPVGAPLAGHTAGVWALTAWSGADGTTLAAGGDDGEVRVWNVERGRPVLPALHGHTAGVWALVHWTRPDGERLIGSTGDDGTIRRWIPGAGPAGEPMVGHSGWVPALCTWRTPAGGVGLVSGGVDGIRRWDADSGLPIGDPLHGHDSWVLSLATWVENGVTCLASGGVDGTVRLWQVDPGTAIGDPLVGHTGWVRALAVWQGPDGRVRLASGGYDGVIQIWDPTAGTTVCPPVTGHNGRVAALATWTGAGGDGRLASAGTDGLVRLWDLDSGTAVVQPLSGHEGGIWALTSWTDVGGQVRLASAGHDGTVRFWDPERGRIIRSIEVGPVSMWGVADTPTERDVIGRQLLADAIADQLSRRVDRPDDQPGPTVVGVEGPWGCGKSTLMRLIRQRLPGPLPPHRAQAYGATVLTVAEALRQINRYPVDPMVGTGADDLTAPRTHTVVTAWFNPWGHQSGEQVWAGLASEIIEAAAPILYPTEAARERYWFTRNLARVDRHAVRVALRQRTRSPILGLAVAALVVPVAIAIAGQSAPPTVLGPAAPVLLGIAVTMGALLVGIAQTAVRRAFGRAAHYLPAEMFRGPVIADPPLSGDPASAVPTDPLRRARAGTLYLYQHNIGDIVDDLAAQGCDLVVFVDDIDRCRADTTAEVFEAINVFLANVTSPSGLRARFVVGYDAAVVAAHLDALYRDHDDRRVALHGDDPTPGWAFLRKLIQLPVQVPQVRDDGVERFVDSITRLPAPPVRLPPPARPAVAVPASAPAPRRIPAPRSPMMDHVPPPPVDTVPWRAMEQHPEVRELVVCRLAAQPDRSLREGKRMLNLWQLYARVLGVVAPLDTPAEEIIRARRLLLVAEIATRWPAMQRAFNRRCGDRRGLWLLADAAEDDDAWQRTAAQLGLLPGDGSALVNLRTLLREYDGRAVADLADQVM